MCLFCFVVVVVFCVVLVVVFWCFFAMRGGMKTESQLPGLSTESLSVRYPFILTFNLRELIRGEPIAI